MKKRIIALCLTAILLPGLFSACGETPEKAEETPTQQTVNPEAITVEEETESLTPHWDAVQKEDLGGMNVDITCATFTSNYYNVVDWDEISGEMLADAMYDRNRYIEAQLNCLMVLNYSQEVSKLEQSVISGSGDVDLTYALLSNGGGLLQKGYLTPFNKLETIDMTQPYWDQGSQRDLKLLGQMFYGFVDFGFDHYDSMTVLFYNGELLTQFQLEDPQELFLEDAWTIDKMVEQLKAVSTDVDGNGQFNLKKDIYGLVGREYNFQPIQHTSGIRLVTWDEGERIFQLNMVEERFIDISTAIANIYAKTNPFTDYSDYDQARIAFSDGRALYYSRLLGDFRQLREVEDDYGVICFPKYEVGCEASYFIQNPTTLFLPLIVGDDNGDREEDFNEIGIFLEAQGAYTFDNTLNVYIENAVIGKGMRDEKSAEMVRIMIQNRSFDLTQAYNFPSIAANYAACVISNGNYASVAKKMERNFNKSAQKIVAEIEDHLD
ncbi:MAG: extracellular solute-binding protein [Clostridia bacterium]|nr:extracellular solute-binding protein [Clostridia bacterium]